MAKNIVICCDGTGNEFGDRNSNVIKLYKTLVCSEAQVAYYHPGVGTMGARNALTQIGKWWTRIIGLAFGYGISDNVADAYQFLMRTFAPGDRIFVFGFSRGAYTARALCGMLHIIGLLRGGNEGLIPYAVRMIKSKRIDFKIAAEFKKTFSRECKAHFVGVWDTVSSVGWVYNAVRFPYLRATANPDFNIVRHAVSVDERRAFFRQNLFGEPASAQQDVKEVWFAGVHSDVGGSYPEAESQLSKIALDWMLTEAEASGLAVDAHRRSDILGAKPPYVAPDALTRNQHESLCRWWWIAEFWPKVVHTQTSSGEWKRSIYLNLGRRRWISPGSFVHESVDQRLRKASPPYRPSNLPKQHQAIFTRKESGMATAMPPRINFFELVNTVADKFETTRQMTVTPDGREALIKPAIPYETQVEDELRSGKITQQFLSQSVTLVLDNGFEIARAQSLSSIDGYVVRESMKKYCPYIMWC